MKTLIIGASGYVGSALYGYFKQNGDTVIGTSFSHPRDGDGLIPLDITNQGDVIRVFAETSPEVVIVSSGLVDACFTDPELAREVNIDGTQHVINGVKAIGSKLVYISSTAVYDGVVGQVTESSERKSNTPYGKMKIEAEDMVTSAGVEHLIARPSLVWGNASPDAMAPRTYGIVLDAILDAKPLELDNEKKLNPTWNKDLFSVINKWMSGEIQDGPLNVACEEIMTKYEVAVTLSRQLLGCASTNIFPIGKKQVQQQIIDPTLLRSYIGEVSAHHMINGIALEIQQSQNPETFQSQHCENTMHHGKERF